MRYSKIKKLAKEFSQKYYVGIEDGSIYNVSDNKPLYRDVFMKDILEKTHLTNITKANNLLEILIVLMEHKSINTAENTVINDLNNRVTKLENMKNGV